MKNSGMGEKPEASSAPFELDPVRKLFEEQFAHPEHIETEYSEFLPKSLREALTGFMVYDLVPERLESETPIVFLPGITPNPINNKEMAWQWYKRGRRVIFPDSPHGIHVEPKEGFEQPQLRKAAAVLEMLRQKNITGASAVAHSEGGAVFAMAAKLLKDAGQPQVFRDVVLVEPVGVIGSDNLKDLAQRSNRERVEEEKRHKENPNEFWWQANFWRDPRYYFGLTFPQTFSEALAVSKMDIRPLLRELKQSKVRMVIVQGAKSHIFPMDRIQVERNPAENDEDYENRVKNIYNSKPEDIRAMSEAGEFKSSVGLEEVDGVVSADAYHQDLLLNPSRYAGAVYGALQTLEKNRDRGR